MANGDTLLLQQIHDRVMAIDAKLDTKCDKEDCDQNEERIHELENKTSNIVAKQAGVAGLASGLMIAVKQIFLPGS